jgi:hypothetical protein
MEQKSGISGKTRRLQDAETSEDMLAKLVIEQMRAIGALRTEMETLLKRLKQSRRSRRHP